MPESPFGMKVPSVSRRAALHAVAPLLLSALPALQQRPAEAFENRLPPDELELKYKSPRTPGPKPMDIGPREGGKLKSCIDGKPHCFSSTPEVFEDDELYNADYGTTQGWLVEPFRYDAAVKSTAEALADVKQAVAAYPPGQRGIDGGGFRVVSESSGPDSAYLYVQFESLRKGYVDVSGHVQKQAARTYKHSRMPDGQPHACAGHAFRNAAPPPYSPIRPPDPHSHPPACHALPPHRRTSSSA